MKSCSVRGFSSYVRAYAPLHPSQVKQCLISRSYIHTTKTHKFTQSFPTCNKHNTLTQPTDDVDLNVADVDEVGGGDDVDDDGSCEWENSMLQL